MKYKPIVMPIPSADFKSPGDLTATYLTGNSLTIAVTSPALTITDVSQFVYVKQVCTGREGAIYENASGSCYFSYAGGVLTIHGCGDEPFADGDVYEVGVNYTKTLTITGDINVDNVSVDTSGVIGKPAGSDGDFTTAYSAATDIACVMPSWYPNLTADDIETIRQISAAGVVLNTYSRDDAGITVAANVVTVAGATFGATDTFVIFTNVDETNYHLTEIQAALTAGMAIPDATHRSPVDFTAAYTSNITITLTGLPIVITDNSQLVYIKQILAANTSNLWINGINCTLGEAGGVITIYGAGTPFVVADDYEVGINEQEKAYDATLDIDKVIDQSPAKDWWTDFIDYTTFTATSVAYIEGAVISTGGFTDLNFAWSKTASTADDSYLKVIYLTDAASAVDYQQITLGNPVGGVIMITSNVYQIDKAAGVNTLQIPTKGFPFMRLDIAKATDTGTDAVFTTKINKRWV